MKKQITEATPRKEVISDLDEAGEVIKKIKEDIKVTKRTNHFLVAVVVKRDDGKMSVRSISAGDMSSIVKMLGTVKTGLVKNYTLNRIAKGVHGDTRTSNSEN